MKKFSILILMKKIWSHSIYFIALFYLAFRILTQVEYTNTLGVSVLVFVCFFIAGRYVPWFIGRYIFGFLGFISFLTIVNFFSIKFIQFNQCAFVLLIMLAYILPDVISVNLMSIIISIQYYMYKDELISYGGNLYFVTGVLNVYIFGAIITAFSFSVIFRLIRSLTNDRNMYKNLSITDTLTGFYTLSYVLEKGQDIIENGEGLGVMVFDMDRFKHINDTYGHVSGNNVLVQISRLLRNQTKGISCTFGRFGGDEFVILIENLSFIDIESLSKNLHDAMLERSFVVDPDIEPIKLSFSVGYAYCPPGIKMNIESLLNRADINMYYNKYEKSKDMVYSMVGDSRLSDKLYQLLAVLAEKDMYTYVHSEHVAQNAVEISKKLGMNEQFIDDIFIAGWLHDIGKILVSRDILRKRGKLTEDEYVTIKQHVINGLKIISDMEFSDTILNAVKYHHERWDGNGYPFGVSHEDIPIEARILQIADVFSTMSIKRVYHKPLSADDAIKELERCSGTQFDPKLVTVFTEVLKIKSIKKEIDDNTALKNDSVMVNNITTNI